MYHPFRLLILASLTSLATGCADQIVVTVAPHMGQTTDCVPWQPIPDDVAAWLDGNPVPVPPGWDRWAGGFINGQVKPKLERDCQ